MDEAFGIVRSGHGLAGSFKLTVCHLVSAAVFPFALASVAFGGDAELESAGNWYRLTVDAVRSGNEVQFSEFYLYDAQGTRLNSNLKVASVTDASQLDEGECFQTGMSLFTDVGVERLFDNNRGTKLGGTVTAGSKACVTLRLQDEAAAVAAYNFATCGDDDTWGKNRQLTAWTLEFSEDGQTWVEIDKREGFNPPQEKDKKYSETNFTVGPIPSANRWITEPSVLPTSWADGETAGTISMGVAKYGTDTITCNYTQEQLNALEVGEHTVTFTVEATADYTGLEKCITVSVLPEGLKREITSATLLSDVQTCELSFSPAEEGAKDLKVWAVADATDKGMDGTNGWSKVAFVDVLKTDEDEKTFVIPDDWNWGSDVRVLRFLTTPVYDAMLEGLVGNRGDASIGPVIDTGFKPQLTDKLVVDLTTADLNNNEYETVFSARRDNMANDKAMTVFICHQTANAYAKRFRFDYGTYDSKAQVSMLASTGDQLSATTRYEVILDGNMASVTGMMNPKAVTDLETGDAGDTLLLFAARADLSGVITTNHVGKFTLHSFKGYDSTGTLLHDYIPVVADGVNTLYDKVDGKVMTVSKAGTGAGNFGARGEPTPVAPLTWSQAVYAARGLILIFGPAD